jgi:hypothetical protein
MDNLGISNQFVKFEKFMWAKLNSAQENEPKMKVSVLLDIDDVFYCLSEIMANPEMRVQSDIYKNPSHVAFKVHLANGKEIYRITSSEKIHERLVKEIKENVTLTERKMDVPRYNSVLQIYLQLKTHFSVISVKEQA